MSAIQRAIKIFARLKPSDGFSVSYEINTADSKTNDEILRISNKMDFVDDGYINNKQDAYSFRYTQVFDRQVQQDYIFEQVAQPVVDSALEGYNGTIFAYGQTGSGKTFTMTGSHNRYDDRGVIPRTLSYVFQRFQEDNDSNTIRSAYVSYLEIYNEGGYDLLHNGMKTGRLEELAKVTIMEDGHKQMHLRNLSVHPIKTEEEALHLLYLGDHNRTVAETPLNEASTRSHCIFTIHINIREIVSSTVRRSKIHLVDLAGSERIANSTITGQLLSETRHINLALHYLEQVIVALGDSKRLHIPYRNSMMTSILRDSLGGNCMTSMIATLSMESSNILESLSTCRFSQRVALVTNAAVRNEELDPQLVINQLKQEIKALKETIASSAVKPLKENSVPLTQDEYSECCTLVERFLRDDDPANILAVTPDMRMIQACFRILKLNVNSSTSKSGSQSTKLSVPCISTYPSSMKNDDLIRIIDHRDAEIRVLVGMLHKEKSKPKSASNKVKDSKGGTSGSARRFSNASESVSDSEESTIAVLKSLGNESQISQLSAVVGDEEKILEGMSTEKRQALDVYLSNYSERNSIDEVRSNLLKKRAEILEIEAEVVRNKSSLKTVKDILGKSASNSREYMSVDSENLDKAKISQERTIEMQETRLRTCQQQVTESLDMLKSLYAQLLIDFEESWCQNENKDGKEAEMDKQSFSGVANVFKRILVPLVLTEIFQEMESLVSTSSRKA